MSEPLEVEILADVVQYKAQSDEALGRDLRINRLGEVEGCETQIVSSQTAERPDGWFVRITLRATVFYLDVDEKPRKMGRLFFFEKLIPFPVGLDTKGLSTFLEVAKPSCTALPFLQGDHASVEVTVQFHLTFKALRREQIKVATS